MSTFDSIRASHSEVAPPESTFEPYKGCPDCHTYPNTIHVGRQRIGFCLEDRCYWLDGLDPWSPPFAETETKERKQRDMLGLENFKKVEMWMLGRRVAA